MPKSSTGDVINRGTLLQYLLCNDFLTLMSVPLGTQSIYGIGFSIITSQNVLEKAFCEIAVMFLVIQLNNISCTGQD